MSQKLLSTYTPLVVFPVLSALALKLTIGNAVASGLAPELESQCPDTFESLPYRLQYTGSNAIDVTLCTLVSFFHLAFTPPVRPLLTYFLATFFPLFAIPAFEAVRTGRPIVLALPVVLGLAGQLWTIGAMIPLYWLAFILSGAASAKPSPSASSSVSSAHAQAVSFSLLAGAVAPSVSLLMLEDPYVTALWQLFPVWQLAAQAGHLLVRPAKPGPGVPANGFGWVQAFYVVTFVVGSSIHVGTLFAAPSLRDVFLPSVAPRIGEAPELNVLNLLQWDAVFAFGSTLLATVWFARTTSQALTIVLWNIVGSVVVGPGAAIAAVALWRESYLHTEIPEEQNKS
ncbi:hypothetical protein DFH08DRAFT_959311 [Mycena albidolilacea]|uniref:Uncharacterized protein n=1 Tax=Mycena albidolilacea TaxID=1033008 RepID=A0AAD7A430_9AGAR|nr:hypothetical protein DFH08DRAFT_959311 [Mycena albidolilacea]